LVRLGARSIAAGAAALAISFSYLWLAHDGPLASGASYAELSTGSLSSVVKSWSNRSEPAPRSSFGERFAFESPTGAEPLQSSQTFVSFDDRFSGEASASGGPVRSSATRRASVARAMTPTKRPVIAQSASKRPLKRGYQLASASDETLALGYAPADPANDPAVPNSLKALVPKDTDPLADIDTSHTAIYDISARTVYLPNGRRLEAHSGLGKYMDDARYVSQRMTGPTPPNVYKLKMRESLFHGVRAIRLIPKDDSRMNGRSGILAHSYMLGPDGQSNGCVSFSNYSAFLDAYLRGDVTHLVVVERLAEAPSPKTAADWLSNALKDFFRRS
jgi:hypothetical protein